MNANVLTLDREYSLLTGGLERAPSIVSRASTPGSSRKGGW
jgi:hypothetical protein